MADDKTTDDKKEDTTEGSAATEPKEIFMLSAEALVVKLHAAAMTQLKNMKGIVLKNAGIIDEAEGITPENIGKAKFDIDAGPDYEVAVFATTSFATPYELLDKDYKKTVTSNQKLDSDKIKEIEETLEKENAERMKKYKAAMDKCKKDAKTALTTYFEVFAGKDAANKIKSAEFVDYEVPEVKSIKDLENIGSEKGKVAASTSLVDKVGEANAELVKQFKEEAKKKTSKLLDKEYEHTFCIKTAYTLNLGK